MLKTEIKINPPVTEGGLLKGPQLKATIYGYSPQFFWPFLCTKKVKKYIC
jgi:hypothetical protein